MKLFSLDIKVVATAYVRAESEEEAIALVREHLVDGELQFSSRYQPMGEGICIDGSSYEQTMQNEEAIALSPAMTISGPFEEDFTLDEIDV